jgi:hypothetical protein
MGFNSLFERFSPNINGLPSSQEYKRVFCSNDLVGRNPPAFAEATLRRQAITPPNGAFGERTLQFYIKLFMSFALKLFI